MPGPSTNKGATISACGKFRYSLWRIWDRKLPSILFIGLNPSTADADLDDPTVRKCVRFAQRWGYGGIYVANLFAHRATSPKDMIAATDPVGPENDAWLEKLVKQSGLLVAAWGNNGAHLQRSATIRKRIPDLHYLRLNKSGEPAHPLYLPQGVRPSPWQRTAVSSLS